MNWLRLNANFEASSENLINPERISNTDVKARLQTCSMVDDAELRLTHFIVWRRREKCHGEVSSSANGETNAATKKFEQLLITS